MSNTTNEHHCNVITLSPANKHDSPVAVGKLRIRILDCFLNVPIQRPYVVITLGEQKYTTSVSEYEHGQWHETFELFVSFHTQLFGTIQLDLFDSYTLLPNRHIGRSEMRLRLFEGMPQVFTSYYEIWEKKLSAGASSSVGQRKTMAINVGAIQAEIAYCYQSEHSTMDTTFSEIKSLSDKESLLQLSNLTSDVQQPVASKSSNRLLTEEQLAIEFKRHLKFQKERRKDSIRFCKYEEENKILDESLDYPDDSSSEYEEYDEDEDKQASIALNRRLRKKSSLSVSTARVSKAPGSVMSRDIHTPAKKTSTWFGMFKPAVSPSAPIGNITKVTESQRVDSTQEESPIGESSFNTQYENTKGYPLLETIGAWTVNKEINQILKTIGKLLASFGQGFELTNLQVLTGFSVLETFYANLPRDRTWNIVEDLSEIELAAHFWKFSVASYGWKGLNFIGKGNGYFTDAMRNHSDALSVIEYLSIPKEDLLAYEFRSAEAFRPSYFIVRDRTTNSIVLCIRGTMSVFDTMTDLVCEYEPWRGGLIHKGMKAAATWFYRNVAPQLIAYSNTHYTSALYIVGHSLGAATAAILTIMLTDHLDEFLKDAQGEFSLRCFGYAPACGLSLNLAEKYKDYIQSFVFADDVVSKLSYGSMMDVKELIIASSEAAKGLGVGGVLWSGNVEDEKWKYAFERISECRERCLDSMANPRLYIAGQVYQFWLDPTPSNDTRIVIERTDAERVSKEIIVRKSILLDHLPTNFDIAFRRAREALMIETSSYYHKDTLKPEGILDDLGSENALPAKVDCSEDSQCKTTEPLERESPTMASNAIWQALANLSLKNTSQYSSSDKSLV